MNTNEVKQTVYCFLKNKISEKFPDKFPLAENGATNKIFWANIKSDSPQRPIIILSTVYKSRLHKRFNPYYKNNIRYEPEQWRLTVKFEVKTAASDGNLYEAEKLGNTIIDFIEKLFSNTQATFDYFGAWYYVLDEENTEFYLPQTNGFMQFGTVGGQYNEAGLPNITGKIRHSSGYSDANHLSDAFYFLHQSSSGYKDRIDGGSDSNYTAIQAGFDASRSNPIYGKSNTVQPNAITGYLYFYVGNAITNQEFIDISAITECLSRKLDIPLRYIVEKSDPSYLPFWYNVYNDGWIEQGGATQANVNSATVTFLKNFTNTNYCIVATDSKGAASSSDTDGVDFSPMISNCTTNGFRVTQAKEADRRIMWHAFGY